VPIKEVIKMPRLSEKTLEKRFQCDYCGGTFRSRQGLSGHIQFKHQDYFEPVTKSKHSTKEIDMGFISSKNKDFSIWRASNGLSESTNDAITKMFVSWTHVRSLFNMLDIELTEQDFKTYLLVGLNKLFS
jgi:predicted RNA binding protein YcfA (HicA-like mRNA interferase family)